jgi:hypothetical protein
LVGDDDDEKAKCVEQADPIDHFRNQTKVLPSAYILAGRRLEIDNPVPVEKDAALHHQ